MAATFVLKQLQLISYRSSLRSFCEKTLFRWLPPRADTSTSATRMSKQSRTGLPISTRSRFKRENFSNFFANLSQANSEFATCSKWSYDDSEFKDTIVTENDWVCGIGHYVADLYTLGVVGLILGTFVFRCSSPFSDFFLAFNRTPLSVPLPTSTVARRASTSGSSPSCSSLSSRSLSATAMICLLCSR